MGTPQPRNLIVSLGLGLVLAMGIIAGSRTAEAGKSLGNGQACKFDSDCDSSRCYRNKCAAKGNADKNLSNGADCKFDSQCDSGRCYRNTCSAKGNSDKQLANGATCKFDSQCDSGRCSQKVCKKR